MAKTLIQLLNSVKDEARVSAGDDLDTFIKDIINQEYRNLCENVEFPQLVVPFAALTIASAAQSVYSLPVGLRRIIAVEFASASTVDSWRPLTLKNGFAINLSQGSPNWYFRAGNNLHVYPYSSIATSQGLRITYLKNPTPLTADGHVLDVEELEGTLLKKVVARVLRYHKDTAAEVLNAEAAREEIKVVN